MTATAVILPSGETLGGFRIVDVLGLGGMAVVYRAEQLSLHREVALKVLSAELGRDEVLGSDSVARGCTSRGSIIQTSSRSTTPAATRGACSWRCDLSME